MEVGQVKLQNLLAGVVQYRVPLFQRTYNWSEPQWSQLWDDILAIYGSDETRTHFVGSMVTQPMLGAAGGATKYALIDGQQRLTTLTILLCAIRDRARQESDKWGNLPDAIQKMYLINEFADAAAERNKLAPTAGDAVPFRAMIDGDVPSTATRIGAARRYFSRALNRGDANGAPLDLRKLANDCVASRLDMVSITLNPNDNPNRIFESLNNTGLSLSAFDLIRNYAFMSIRDPRKRDDAYERYWLPMQETLGREARLDRQTIFFWRYLAMDGSLPKRERGVIFDGVRELIGTDADDDAIINALKEFHEFSGYYMEVVDSFKYGKSEALSNRINRISLWGAHNAVNTFLLRAMSHVRRGDIREDELATMIEMIESFLVRRHLRGYTQAGLRDIFARILKQAQFVENQFVRSTLSVLGNYYWPSDAEFIEAFSWFHLYGSNARYPRAWLILSTLEDSFGSKVPINLNGENITIEHIMPQALTNEWRSALGANHDEIHGILLHTLGNLTLTGYNPEMSNKPFREKKTVFAKSKFELNSSLKEIDEWNSDTIQRRGRELAERAAKIWRRPYIPGSR